ILLKAKEFDRMSDLAKTLELGQTKQFHIDGKSSDDVFKILELNKAGDQLFTNQQLPRLLDYVSTAKKKNSNLDEIATLRSFYKDKTLAKMISAAGEGDTKSALVTKVEKALKKDNPSN
ncbi:hypothetical protein L915_14575, partial [Phytophthora nicotianae]